MSGSPEVTIDGEKQAVTGNPSTYAELRRVWHDDTLQITLPQSLSLSPLPDLPDTVAFMEGPVVLAGVLGDGPEKSGAETLTEKTLYYKDKDPRTILIPDNEREFARWRIGYRTLDQTQSIRFIPLYEIRDESYAVYFPVREMPS
jgi:DUF1680 family protein